MAEELQQQHEDRKRLVHDSLMHSEEVSPCHFACIVKDSEESCVHDFQ